MTVAAIQQTLAEETVYCVIDERGVVSEVRGRPSFPELDCASELRRAENFFSAARKKKKSTPHLFYISVIACTVLKVFILDLFQCITEEHI